MATATNQQLIAGLYTAFFDRAPDQNGLQYWENQFSGNATVKTLAGQFAEHPVFTETYADMSDAEFVQNIYQNVLGGQGETSGVDYWVAQLEGGMSRSDMVANFVSDALTLDLSAFTDLTAEELAAAQARQDTLTNKVNVGLHFVEKFGAASNLSADTDTTTKAGLESDPVYLASQAAIANVTNDDATVTAANDAIDAAASPADLNDGGTPVFTLTQGLEDLQAAQADAAEALAAVAVAVNANADKPEVDDPDDNNDAYDQFVAGFDAEDAADAAAAAVQAIEDEQANIDIANANLLSARATTFSAHGDDDAADLLVAAKLVTATTVMTDANVAKAAAAAQAAVDSDKAVYNDVGNVVVAADGKVQDGYTKVYQLADKSFTSDATAEGASFVGYAKANPTTDVTESDLVIGGDANGVAGDDSAGTPATPATVTIGVDASYNGILTIGGLNVTISNGVAAASELANIETLADVKSVSQADGVITIIGTVSDNNSGDGNAETAADLSGLNIQFAGTGSADASYVADDVFKGVSASDLQNLLAEAEADLTADEATNGTATELLTDLRAAINAYAAAEGNLAVTVDSAASATLATIRSAIAGALDTDGATADEVEEAAEGVLATIAGYADSADQAGKEFGDFAPVLNDKTNDAQESALISAFEAISDRQDLVNAVETAEGHFTQSAGAVLVAADSLQQERDGQIQAVTAAETAKADAAEYAATIADLVAAYAQAEEAVTDAQDALETAGVESLITLTENTTGTLFGADLFVYSAGNDDITIGRFESDDQLFIGTGFKLVALTADDDLVTDRLGDASALEVFAQQDGNNVVLYVEQEAFAGNDTGAIANSDFETITLTGATLEDLVFSNGALVSVA